jgi:hypothetical protein
MWEASKLSKGCSFCRDVQNILSADIGISRQTEGHSLGDHLISGSVSVTSSSVTEASIVLCSVSLWFEWVNVQSACALNTRYFGKILPIIVYHYERNMDVTKYRRGQSKLLFQNKWGIYLHFAFLRSGHSVASVTFCNKETLLGI